MVVTTEHPAGKFENITTKVKSSLKVWNNVCSSMFPISLFNNYLNLNFW